MSAAAVAALAVLAIAFAPAASAAPAAPVTLAEPPSRPRTERRIERDVASETTRAVVVHAFGECRVLAASARERPRALLEVVASGAGADVERRYLQLADLAVASEPLPDDPGRHAATIRSLFPPRDQKPQELSFAAKLTVWLPEGASLELENGFGKVVVEVRGGDVKVVNKLGLVELRGIRGTVNVENQFDAIRVADVTGDAFLRGKLSAITAERVGGLVDVRTSGGAVTIADAGSVRIESQLKPVEVRDVKADARIVAPFCAVTAIGVGGSLTIDSGNETVRVEGVGGDLSIQHKTGKVDARRVRGSATVRGHLTDVTLVDVGGAAEVRSAAAPVKVAGVGGRLVAENSARTLEIEDARGDVEASALGGLLKARFARLPADGAKHEITLLGEAGGIEIELPDGARARVEVTSTTGQIDCELPGMSFAQSGASRTGTLELGDADGKRVELRATCVGGAIRVRRAIAR